MTFNVTIRRIVREDTVVTVEAANKDEALNKARLAAPNVPQEKWDGYDCDYWDDGIYAVEGNEGAK